MDSTAPAETPNGGWLQRWLGLFRGRWSRLELLLLGACPVLLVVTALVTERVRMTDHVMPGVMLEDQLYAGYSVSALRQSLQRQRAEMRAQLITVQIDGADFRLLASELDADINVEDVVRRMMKQGRSDGLLSQVLWRARRFRAPSRVALNPTYDAALWHEYLTAFERAALTTPKEGGLRYEAGKLQRIEPVFGKNLDFASATQQLDEILLGKRRAQILPALTSRAPQTDKKSVDEVEKQACEVLAGPVKMKIVLPEIQEQRLEEAKQLTQDAQLAVTFTPKQLGPALRTRQTAEDPHKLELLLDPERLEQTLASTRRRWEQPALDAKVDLDQFGRITVSPSQIRTRLDTTQAAEALLRAARSPERKGELLIQEAEQPRITTEIANNLGITGLVGQFTTQHPCCRPRVKNIHHIADLVDGSVVLPGEIFSVNALVGPRSASNGFVAAPTIVHGEMSDTFGGGISQFATTLFNAVFNAGYEIIERQPHSYYFTRYPVGHEATLSYPKPDFIFRNDTKSGVLIKTQYGSTYIRVRIYGNNEGRKVKREVSKRFDIVVPPVEYEADDSLKPDEEKVVERGASGFSVLVSRILTAQDGQVTRQERKVIYNPRTRRIRVHSCKIPEGEEGYTGEPCPEPEETDAGVPDELPRQVPL